MITAKAALDAILDHCSDLSSETVAIEAATGRSLRQTVVAERDQPPFDRVTMDGIAFSVADLNQTTRELPLQTVQLAGEPAVHLRSGQCVEIMTGAALPIGADTVVPVERIVIDDGRVTLDADCPIDARQYIHPRASDYAQGETLLTPGRKISALDVAVIASSGLVSVEVARQPILCVVSTGNELVPPGDAIADHQIRLSNGPALCSLLEANQFHQASHDHLIDDVAVLQDRLAKHLANADVLVLSGGVSKGKADFVPEVLRELGVEEIFHRVSQRPGKPLWFGKGQNGQLVFGLPGNPVSALVCCRRYVIPALQRMSGRSTAPPEIASLAKRIAFPAPLTCFQPVRLQSNAAGTLLAMPIRTNTSGDFRALAESDGYVELARDENEFEVGSGVFLTRWIDG